MQEGQYESSVPVIMDRCHQARVKNALEPEWEARFEPRSYGFRPGRGCHDAIAAIFNVCGPMANRVWALDADLAAALDPALARRSGPHQARQASAAHNPALLIRRLWALHLNGAAQVSALPRESARRGRIPVLTLRVL